MGSLSLWHWLIVIAVVLLMFGGRGKISDVMGDFAKGIKSFKKGLADDESAEKPTESTRVEDAKTIEQQTFIQPELPEPRGEPLKKAAAPKKASTAKTTAAKTTTRKKSSS